MKEKNYSSTIGACFIGYVVQAIVVNFAPLLFVTFQRSYGIGLTEISFLIVLLFGVQLFVDWSSAFIVGCVGYRRSAVLGQFFAATGLILLAVLPEIMPDPYVGLLISATVYAIGSGLIEVIISPIVENCPTKRKAAMMSLLHSFYCWGQLFTVLVSTVCFVLLGIENWRWVALLWAVVPIVDGILFCFVPMPDNAEAETERIGMGALVKKKRFWLLALIMLCGGASELCISQWASAFAQMGLGVDKTLGDLMGPCMFAAFMGTARVLYAKIGHKMNIQNAMILCGGLCAGSYLLAALAPIPALGLAGCALAGFAVGIFWPCALSMGAGGIKNGGMVIFALLALFGDAGCTVGPLLVGTVSDAFGGELSTGILTALVFPVLLIIGVLLFKRDLKKNGKKV